MPMFIKLMILAVVVACAAPFFLKGPDGQPLMTIDQFIANEHQNTNLPDVSSMTHAAKSSPTRVYKWKDSDGVWHFSDSADDAPGAEMIEVDGPVNTMQATATGNNTTSLPAAQVPAQGERIADVSPDQLKQAMQAAEKLQQTIDQRKSDIDQAVDQ